MPGKSRHGKSKHSILSKRRKERQRSLATTTRQPITSQTYMLAPPTSKVDSKVSMPGPSETPATGQYHYVIVELMRIGILTGILLVILIVLALVLRQP